MEKRLVGCVDNGEETGWLCGEETGWLSGEWRREWLPWRFFDKGVDQLMEIHYCSSRYIIYA